jgi:hypothetical protein
MIWNDIELTNEEKLMWSVAMQSIYRKLNQSNTIQQWSRAEYLLFQCRVGILRNEKFDLYTFLRGTVRAPVEYGDFRVLYPFLDQVDQRKLLRYIYNDLRKNPANETDIGHQLINLAILCDSPGYPELASDIYIYKAKNGLEIPDHQNRIWANVMLDQAVRYNDGLMGGDGQVSAICYYVRLLNALKDSNRKQYLLEHLQTVQCRAEDWVRILDVVSATGDKTYSGQVRLIANTKYPGNPAFRQ